MIWPTSDAQFQTELDFSSVSLLEERSPIFCRAENNENEAKDFEGVIPHSKLGDGGGLGGCGFSFLS